jgi:hypothetical protein
LSRTPQSAQQLGNPPFNNSARNERIEIISMSAVIRGDRCVCGGCGELFNSTYAHAKHRVGPYSPINKPETRRCLSVDQMLAKGMSRNSAGFWIAEKRTTFSRVT